VSAHHAPSLSVPRTDDLGGATENRKNRTGERVP
jgi:hypothetical protein